MNFRPTEIIAKDGKLIKKPKHLLKKPDWIFEESLYRCMVSPSSVMIKRELFNEVGFFNESYPACEDYDLWLRITYKYRVGLIDEELMIRYAGHDDQLSATVSVQDKYRIDSIYTILNRDILSENQRDIAFEVLSKKIKIMQKGLLKREKIEEFDYYESLFQSLKIKNRVKRNLYPI
jgi:GT2 family glycosyltransferase